MLKIRKITVENFRGIKSPAIIDFVKGGNPTSALIYGRNGTGKSSITDAWEWLINGKIESFSKEGINENDYPHKLSHGDNVYIEIELSDPVVFSVKSTFNKTRISLPIHTGDFAKFKSHTVYPNFLRYSDLQDFVYRTKGDKYKYIAKYFGLDVFAMKQAGLQTSYTKIENIFQSYSRQHVENIKNITKLIGRDQFDESVVVDFINSIGIKYGLNTITQFKDVDKVKKALSEIVLSNPIAKELAECKEFQQKLEQLYDLPDLSQEVKELEDIFKDLKDDEANIKNLILIDLYNAASDTLSRIDNKNQCPVCDQVFDGDLEQYILIKKKPLYELNNKKLLYLQHRNSIIEKLELIIRRSAIIQLEKSENILSTFNTLFDDVKIILLQLPNSLGEIKKTFSELHVLNLETQQDFLAIEKLREKKDEYQLKIEGRIKALSENESSKNLAMNFDYLIQIITSYTSHLKNQRKVDYLSEIISNIAKINIKLTSYIQTQIQNIFSAIQEDVVYCYNFLESSNRYLKNPAIKLVSGRDKAIELEIEFADEKVTPAYKFMSESQVNSFGLAIFLAATKYFNSNFKFIILDDIVNSFDAFKRPKVSQLIANRFSDFQVLMLTHDQIFFDTVQNDFPQWTRYKFTDWDLTTGPRCIFSRNFVEEIQKLLEEDDPIGAGQKLGRYLEMVFGIINQNMQTPIRYKMENVYTLSEFYEPLVSRFKDKLKQTGKQHRVIRLFAEFEQGTIFRNYCAHYKNEQNQFTVYEIDTIFQNWLKIESELYCPECKSFCSYLTSGGSVYIKCTCGLLDIKDDTKFE